MPKYRRDRINDAVTKELSDIIREVKDPRISDSFLTITATHVTGDLKNATIYYSCLVETDEKELKKGLRSAAPFMRRCLAERLNLRITPELAFVRDEGVKHGAEIAAILKTIHRDNEAETEKTDAGDTE